MRLAFLAQQKWRKCLFIPESKQIQCRLELPSLPLCLLLPPRECSQTELLPLSSASPCSCPLPSPLSPSLKKTRTHSASFPSSQAVTEADLVELENFALGTSVSHPALAPLCDHWSTSPSVKPFFPQSVFRHSANGSEVGKCR